MAGDHIARHRPRRSAESQQRNPRRQVFLDQPDRLVDRRKYAVIDFRTEAPKAIAIRDCIELRALAGGTPFTPAFNKSPNNLLGDGVDANGKPFHGQFPYLPKPHQGYTTR